MIYRKKNSEYELNIQESDKPRLALAGAGFGGLNLTKNLKQLLKTKRPKNSPTGIREFWQRLAGTKLWPTCQMFGMEDSLAGSYGW